MKNTLLFIALALTATSCHKTKNINPNPLIGTTWVSTDDSTLRFTFSETTVLVSKSNQTTPYTYSRDTLTISPLINATVTIKGDSMTFSNFAPFISKTKWYRF